MKITLATYSSVLLALGLVSTPAFAQSKAPIAKKSVAIDVTDDAITIDQDKVVPVSYGTIDSDYKRGSAKSYLIKAVHERVSKAAEKSKAGASVRMTFDPTLTFRLVQEVMYSSASAGVRDFQFGLFDRHSSKKRAHPDAGELVEWRAPGINHRLNRAPNDSMHGPMRQAFANASSLSKKDTSGADKKGAEKKKEADKRLLLKLKLGDEGIDVIVRGKSLAPLEGCPAKGPTVCLRDRDADVAALSEKAGEAYAEFNNDEAYKLQQRAVAAYDFRRLYNKLIALKADHPEDGVVDVVIPEKMPAFLAYALAKRIRYRLPEPSYSDDDSYTKAVAKAADKPAGKHGEALFPEMFVSVK